MPREDAFSQLDVRQGLEGLMTNYVVTRTGAADDDGRLMPQILSIPLYVRDSSVRTNRAGADGSTAESSIVAKYYAATPLQREDKFMHGGEQWSVQSVNHDEPGGVGTANCGIVNKR